MDRVARLVHAAIVRLRTTRCLATRPLSDDRSRRYYEPAALPPGLTVTDPHHRTRVLAALVGLPLAARGAGPQLPTAFVLGPWRRERRRDRQNGRHREHDLSRHGNLSALGRLDAGPVHAILEDVPGL